MKQSVGKIASIDRGWLHNFSEATSLEQGEVGKIASIDRGWLHTVLKFMYLLLERGKNSLD